MSLIITGGAGFIGSNLVRYASANTTDRLVIIDKLTYAGNHDSLESIEHSTQYCFERVDIGDAERVRELLAMDIELNTQGIEVWLEKQSKQ